MGVGMWSGPRAVAAAPSPLALVRPTVSAAALALTSGLRCSRRVQKFEEAFGIPRGCRLVLVTEVREDGLLHIAKPSRPVPELLVRVGRVAKADVSERRLV